MDSNDNIVIAILAKNKEPWLPLFLECIYNQNYNKKNIHLYIRTNDNTDNTEVILEDFINKYSKEYASVYYNKESISEELKKYKNHEWNYFRFKVLGKIRQESVDYAKKLKSHYFVIDCDNFITPQTLNSLFKNRHFGIISPMLISSTTYSNFHHKIDKNGYYLDSPEYYTILERKIKGLLDINVVHCTYFINYYFLDEISYDDESYRYEYVIFSDVLRKKNIPQYLDNREFYGIIDHDTNTKEEFQQNFKKLSNYFSEFTKYGKEFKNL